MQQQWPTRFKEVCRAWTTIHQHSLPSTNSQKESWIHPRSKNWHLTDYVIVRKKGRQDVRVTKIMCVADCWADHRLVVSKQSAHSACTTATRQESAKEIGCLQAETRQQEASIRQWYLQPFRCTGTQFRRCRWELDSLHRSLFSNEFPRTSTRKLVWLEWQRNPETSWREIPKPQGMPQWYQLSI